MVRMMGKKTISDVDTANSGTTSLKKRSLSHEQNFLVKNYTGDEESERDYSPVRYSHENKTGCLGGVMYLLFIVCVSIIFAFFLWMCASDALALNKNNISAVISLPSDVFSNSLDDVTDEDGNVIGSEEKSHVDIDFVSSALKEAGIIEYKWLFKLFCKLSNADVKIDPGTYELKSSLDYRAIVKKMQTGSGAAVTIEVMIPEGFTMHDIFTLLEENGVCSYEELMYAAANSTFSYSFLDSSSQGDATRLEGYLFPDTYEFYVGMQASSAINKLLSNYYYRITADMLKQANDKNRDFYDILIIASLIEKEAAVDVSKGIDERRMVSSVIYNRLDSGMPLGLESSILYIHQDYEGAPTAEMLQEDSPYNSNIYTGLPPTPICNPSLASIQAALNPEETDYFYFYYDEDEERSVFFVNYNELLTYIEIINNE